jgi:spore coat polysaccharide biosynthesis protein SpsF
MTTGAIVQARTSSTRLPKKVLKELPYGSHITVLQQVIRRLKRSRRITEIIIATTTDSEDKAIVKLAQNENVKWFRGSKEDVLSRYYLAAKQNKLDIVVRITSDCPCIDPEIIDLIIGEHLRTKSDYTTNALKRTFPHGIDAEVINFNTLEKVFLEAEQDYEREHVTPYIYKTRPELFNITLIEAPKKLISPDIRITLDTEEDYALLCAVFDYLYPENKFFITKDIIELFKRKPWLEYINAKVVQKKVYNTLTEEIEETLRILDLQDLKMAQNYIRGIYFVRK